MMCPQNVLFKHLPETVKLSGREYPIKTDFRIWLIAREILKSDEALERKAAKLIKLCYKDTRPENLGEALSGIINFYKNAFPKYKSDGCKADFSADFDGCVIYSGFLKTFGIDLSKEDLHWYRFVPLLSELSDCVFSKILEYRGSDISKIHGKARWFYAKRKSAFALPLDKPVKDFAQSLWESI